MQVLEARLRLAELAVRALTERLRLERRRRQQAALRCVCCADGGIETLLVPCNHACACRRCGAGLNACPMCRRPVEGAMVIFIA